MIVIIDEDECIGCGRCEEECPVIFELDMESVSRVKRQPEENEEECVQSAVDACPVAAISTE
ncbi:MAG: ferredoxin [Candidatus Methanomethylophilaceae archaeon]|jgi:ferredoxin